MNKYSLSSFALVSVFLLSSCGGSSPAPWTKPDDSPWKEVPESETSPAAAEDAMFEPVPEPLTYEPATSSMMEEPGSAAITSSMPVDDTMSGGMPAPESIEAETMVVATTAEEAVMAMADDSYAVQVYASKKAASASKFIEENELDNLKVVKTDRGNDVFMYVVIGLYDDRASAVEAATDLERKLGSQPWVRSMPSLQKIVAQ